MEKESLLDTCEAVRALSKKAFAALVQDVGKYFADIYKSLNLKGVAIGSEDFDARWLLSNLALAVILEGYACLPSYEKMEEKKSFTCLLCPEVSNPCGGCGVGLLKGFNIKVGGNDHPGVQERKGSFKGPFPAFRCKPPAVDCLCDVVCKAYEFLKGEASSGHGLRAKFYLRNHGPKVCPLGNNFSKLPLWGEWILTAQERLESPFVEPGTGRSYTHI